MRYVGRFAPSPTGPLHAGSLVAALASWLDARAHQGRWLVRIEDVDTPRTVKDADQHILHQLNACGLVADEPVQWQSKRFAHYQSALKQLDSKGLVYGCNCSRQAILHALELNQQPHQRHTTPRYPGTCERLNLNQSQTKLAQRLKTRPAGTVTWTDRASGQQAEPIHAAVGDFVLKRADGVWAYQLAVVVDDAAQGVTHVVRGADLIDNTARQVYIQQCLGLARTHYLHTPLVMGPDGQKLSKQNNATAVPLTDTLGALREAAARLNLPADVLPEARQPSELLQAWISPWRSAWITAFTPPAGTYN